MKLTKTPAALALTGSLILALGSCAGKPPETAPAPSSTASAPAQAPGPATASATASEAPSAVQELPVPVTDSPEAAVPPGDTGITHAMPPMNATPDREDPAMFYDVAADVHPVLQSRCAGLNVGREVSAAIGRSTLRDNGWSDPASVTSTVCVFAMETPAGATFPNQMIVTFVPDGADSFAQDKAQVDPRKIDGAGDAYWYEYSEYGGSGVRVLMLDGSDLVIVSTLNYNAQGPLKPSLEKQTAVALKVLSMRWAPGHIS